MMAICVIDAKAEIACGSIGAGTVAETSACIRCALNAWPIPIKKTVTKINSMLSRPPALPTPSSNKTMRRS